MKKKEGKRENKKFSRKSPVVEEDFYHTFLFLSFSFKRSHIYYKYLIKLKRKQTIIACII